METKENLYFLLRDINSYIPAELFLKNASISLMD